jgi:hypothetical protein
MTHRETVEALVKQWDEGQQAARASESPQSIGALVLEQLSNGATPADAAVKAVRATLGDPTAKQPPNSPAPKAVRAPGATVRATLGDPTAKQPPNSPAPKAVRAPGATGAKVKAAKAVRLAKKGGA